MIVEKINSYMDKQRKQYPVSSNRAGELGHPCIRYLTFLRVRGEERPIHSLDTQFIFLEGQLAEKSVLRLLEDSGIEVIEQQKSFQWREYQIGGKLDGKIIHEDKMLPLEIKRMSPYLFDKMNTVDDLLKSKYYYKYPAQLTLYLLMDSQEQGIFIIKNPVTGRLKEILLNLDYEYGESLIKKAEQVNTCIADNTIPNPIPWEETCEKCCFKHLCLQEVLRKEIEFVVDQELEELVQGFHELKQWRDEWEKINKKLKERLHGVEKIVIGEYLVLGKSFGTNGWKISYQKL
ncbi:MAG: hypothetical protein A2W17_12530 [Planctomycetes bacterium RBG_16_41_13]|nr:MAG: hypothetical protein A2W17_12530 [Planctomycetes bacterium RBG_16_41_13]